LSRNPELVDAMKEDPRRAPLGPRERALVDYALKLTREPWNMSEEDLEPLRRVGLQDADILDACQVTGYYAFVNRLAQGLGVEIES
jgi:uncharacterized peroxidase-related enzyme